MKFKHLTFRNRLIFSFLLIAVPLILASNGILYFQVKKILERGIENELQQSADTLAGLIRTTAGITIKTRLQGIAEKNFEIAEYYYSKHRSGLMTRQQAINTIEEIFLNQSIGISGYIYCLNSRGDAIIHPNERIKGINLAHMEFARKQMAMKDGYLEYKWKSQGDDSPRLKAVFMAYYKPLDWIISASTYMDEFSYLVDVDEFKDEVLDFKSGKSGYAFIIDESGTFLVHPTQFGEMPIDAFKETAVIKNMLDQKNGKFRYTWQSPKDSSLRDKLVIFKHLPEYHWIIGATSYTDEVYTPLYTFSTILLADILIIPAAFALLAFLASKSITRPLDRLADTLDAGAKGDYTIRMTPGPDDELGKIAGHFNAFMDQLEKYHDQLNQEIQKTVDTQAALVDNELKLRGLFNRSFQFTCILSPYGILEEINQSLMDFAGCTEGEVLYRPYWDMPWWEDHEEEKIQPVMAALQKAKQGETVRLETTHVDRAGRVKNIDMSVKPIFNTNSDVEFIVVEGRDITELKQGEDERRKLAVQLEKSQKMEAIGTLAGGIAHDFNNILSSIFGYAQLAEMTLDTPSKTRSHLAQIVKGAQRATGLVQQILTFSRQNDFEKKPLKFRLVLKEALKLLRSSIPTTIDIVSRVNSRDMVNADPTQMHQVIMNLCTNAFHAMQDTGGVMTVSLDTVDAPEEAHCDDSTKARCGPYLKLEITDTGHGMDRKTLEKAFDPYFTTKEVGHGTGFGLALVHAIVDEHEGFIHAESEPGVGSSFYIYLPVVDDRRNERPSPLLTDAAPIGGSETVMVVDDEPDIRDFIRELLEKFGYTVHLYEDGQRALEAFARTPDLFDLVVTDMTMPAMTGLVLADEISKLRTGVPVILCSGYNDSLSDKGPGSLSVTCFLQKPIINKEFLNCVREALDNT
ncbi:MAG: cache domain-containing protein [Desulfobacter sp.]|nr:MAG: cache domain-containing protein [Desulfobacter sp.]